MMRRLNRLFWIAVLLAACGQPAVRTPTQRPPLGLPPTWTIVATGRPTSGPTRTPAPTRPASPIATPAATTVFTATDSFFTIEIPSNWTTQTGQRQMLSNEQYQMSYAAFGSPGTPPQPAVFIFYKWPNMGAISNDNAWEQAYAVATLAVKVCPVTLTTGGSITIGGEVGKYIGYQDSCGVQGELFGFVHNGVNYGVLIEAPQAAWEQWRPQLRNLLGTLKMLR